MLYLQLGMLVGTRHAIPTLFSNRDPDRQYDWLGLCYIQKKVTSRRYKLSTDLRAASKNKLELYIHTYEYDPRHSSHHDSWYCTASWFKKRFIAQLVDIS